MKQNLHNKNQDADIVVIGSGIAGAMIAYKLAKAGVKVLIIEAGPEIKRQDIVDNFTKTSNSDLSLGFPNKDWAPRPDWSSGEDTYIKQINSEKLKLEYLKNVGGTTWHWSAGTPRFLPTDFKMQTNYQVANNWPISYDDLEPFYNEAEKEMGTSGDSAANYGSYRSQPFPLPPVKPSYCDNIVAKKLAKVGIDFIAKPVARNSIEFDGRSRCQGFGTCSPICPSGAQYNASIHLEKAKKFGAKILHNSPVKHLQTNDSGKITAANIVNSTGESFTVYGKIFVLAANGLENPKLLLMSANKANPNGLANSSGQVGRNFCSQLGIAGHFLMPEPVFAGRGPQENIVSYKFRDGAFRKERSGFILSINNKISLHDITNDLLNKGLEPPLLEKEIAKIAFRKVEIHAHLEDLPYYDNKIELDWNDLDKSGSPRIKLDYSYREYEKRGISYIKQKFTFLAKSLDAKLLKISDPFSPHYLMSTTKMGNDSSTSVIDKELRSHDHKNLFILGSSAFPSAGTANPTLTIAALSLRAAAAVTNQLKI